MVISPPLLIADPKATLINVFMCTSLRPGDQPRRFEVRLNGQDGLDGPTVVRCQLILALDRRDAGRRRGEVCAERRRAIQIRFKELFAFHAA